MRNILPSMLKPKELIYLRRDCILLFVLFFVFFDKAHYFYIKITEILKSQSSHWHCNLLQHAPSHCLIVLYYFFVHQYHILIYISQHLQYELTLRYGECPNFVYFFYLD